MRLHPGPVGCILGAEMSDAAGEAWLALRGSTLQLDMLDPAREPRLIVLDPASAGPVIRELLGAAAAAGAANSVTLGPAASSSDVDWSPGSLWPEAAALTRLLWLAEYSPDPLDPLTLDLEIAATAMSVESLLAEPAELIESRLGPHLARLPELARRFAAGSPVVDAQLLGAALGRALAMAEGDDAPTRAIEDAIARYDAAFDAVLARGRAVDPAATPGWDLSRLSRRGLVAAAHADAAGQPEWSAGRSSVDWLQVPRGVLSSEELGVEWIVESGAATVIDVTAVAAASPAPWIESADLVFRVLGPDHELIGVGQLHLSADRRLFRGRGRLVAGARPAAVDVTDARTLRAPRTGSTASVAEAQRWAVRAVSALRLALASGDRGPMASAQACAERGARLLSQVAARLEPGPAVDDLLARRRAVSALLLAALTVNGRRERAARLQERWASSPAGPLAELDLAAPGWGLTTTESQLLRASR